MPADAVGSRHELDYERGLERLERAGAVVSTVESVLFELLERAGTPEFKQVQKLIVDELTLARRGREAYVLSRTAPVFEGEACAAEAHAVGEVVFTTGMSGYQESVTDPRFASQLITFTYPHIGNYGVSARAMESERIWARAVIMREACNREDAPEAERGWLDWLRDCDVPAISGVDTRALVRHIREAGAMRGGIFPRSIAEDEARALIGAEPSMSGLDLASVVTPIGEDRRRATADGRRTADRCDRHRHQALDRA